MEKRGKMNNIRRKLKQEKNKKEWKIKEEGYSDPNAEIITE